MKTTDSELRGAGFELLRNHYKPEDAACMGVNTVTPMIHIYTAYSPVKAKIYPKTYKGFPVVWHFNQRITAGASAINGSQFD